MSHLITAKRAILAKAESTYDTDPTPTGGANYVEAYDPSDPSYETANAERMPVRPAPGPIATIIGNGPYKLDFMCHLAGSGVAGDPPPLNDLLLACALDDTVTPATSVAYAPLADLGGAMGSVTLYDNLGGVRHKGTGCRGTLELDFPHEEIPTVKFSMTGNRANPADVAVPSVTTTTWKKPVPVNKTNTQFSMHGATPVLHKANLVLGNEVVWKDYANSAQQTRIVNRTITGSISIEAAALATKDWYAAHRDATLGALQIEHGIVAGNIVQVDATDVQITSIKPEDADGIQVLTMDILVTGALTLTFL